MGVTTEYYIVLLNIGIISSFSTQSSLAMTDDYTYYKHMDHTNKEFWSVAALSIDCNLTV